MSLADPGDSPVLRDIAGQRTAEKSCLLLRSFKRMMLMIFCQPGDMSTDRSGGGSLLIWLMLRPYGANAPCFSRKVVDRQPTGAAEPKNLRYRLSLRWAATSARRSLPCPGGHLSDPGAKPAFVHSYAVWPMHDQVR